MVGKIVEYVPKQQTNGYLTYNFPYQKNPPQQNPQQYLQVIIFIIKIRHKMAIMISNFPLYIFTAESTTSTIKREILNIIILLKKNFSFIYIF
jgi:hypothetical protein